MFVAALVERLVGSPLGRRAAQSGFRAYARRRVTHLDRLPLVDVQERTLLQLVRAAQDTRFGRDHSFARIRTLQDYQAQVPLRTYDAFWRDYWQPAFPRLDDVTWPGAIPYLALSSGTTTGATKYLPISPAMLASNRRAALTSLAWFQAAHPEAALFSGRLFFLGGSTDLAPPTANCPQVLAGDLSGIAAREVPAYLRPLTYPSLDVALQRDWDAKLTRFAEESARLPITLVSGVPSWLLVLFERLRQVTGRHRLCDIWPTLRVVVHGGTSFAPYRGLFEELLGSKQIQLLETYPASEGFVAAEDARHRSLRLLPDHQIFYEFVPAGELGETKPTRHTLANLELGVQYAVVLTTCAGLWSYVLGDTVCFERRDPPLLRFTGRTRQFLSAFGEHLIGEEVERAVATAAAATGAAVTDFHVGPVFPGQVQTTGCHRYLVEFARPPQTLEGFARNLDVALSQSNEDYQAHRQGDLTLRGPEVWAVRRGSFAEWLRAQGKLGGQHKLPRLDNSAQLTEALTTWLQQRNQVEACVALTPTSPAISLPPG